MAPWPAAPDRGAGELDPSPHTDTHRKPGPAGDRAPSPPAWFSRRPPERSGASGTNEVPRDVSDASISLLHGNAGARREPTGTDWSRRYPVGVRVSPFQSLPASGGFSTSEPLSQVSELARSEGSWPIPWPKPPRSRLPWPRRRGAVELLARLANEPVERRPVLALDALLELGVDVHRHLRVGVADLALPTGRR